MSAYNGMNRQSVGIDQRPDDRVDVGQPVRPGDAEEGQTLIDQAIRMEEESPQDRDDDDRNDHRQEDRRPEGPGAPQASVQQDRQHERQDHEWRDRPDDIRHGRHDRPQEQRIARKVDEVLGADEGLGPLDGSASKRLSRIAWSSGQNLKMTKKTRMGTTRRTPQYG